MMITKTEVKKWEKRNSQLADYFPDLLICVHSTALLVQKYDTTHKTKI